MTGKLGHKFEKVGVRLTNDIYHAWSAAERECERALHVWFDGEPSTNTEVYFAYVAALDREEAAARGLERAWRMAERSGGPCH